MAVSTRAVARRPRAYVGVRGRDAEDFLQRMLSNDVAALSEGDSCDALLLTAKARVIAPLRVWRRGPEDFLLLTEPDQYIFNPSFHLKVIFIMIAGVNASMFYLTSYRRVFLSPATLEAPTRAKVIAAISLSAWLVVIVCGRLLTFFRPAQCEGEQTALLLTCVPW